MTSATQIVNRIELDESTLNLLESSLSVERFETYLVHANGDKCKALQLYTWNTAISAAFYGPLQALEVALRNAMNRELSKVYGIDWYDNAAVKLDSGSLGRVEKAKKELKKERYPIDAPHMVANLSFGFWVSLLGSGGFLDRSTKSKANYEMTLWRPALRRAFPNAISVSRKDVLEPLSFLRTFRNRIAHHEPIFARHLEQDYKNILEISGWISPQKRQWIETHSRVLEMLATPRYSQNIRF
jgi:Abi-like protein